MSLPTLSTLNTTQDTNKQLANIRSYLIQLKDELEAELSNVTYDMLSASLQKRIDAISEDVAAHNGDLDIMAQTVTANYLTANEIVATYATIESLSAYMITADYVEAGVIKADVISTDIARAEQLSAYMLTANYISGNYIKTDYLDTGAIAARTVTANNICGALSNATQGKITIGTTRCVNYGYFDYDTNSYRRLDVVRLTANDGNQYNFVVRGDTILD